jgi:drug/metabolite transporter (DMT)-like permease
MMWLVFALMTVSCWGLYGVFLHTGQVHMADPVNGRYRAYLFVGIAYFLIAVLAPAAILLVKGAAWAAFPAKGIGWSLLAGTVGAFGAFFVLLAFGARGTPAAVMSIVFAGAPIVNAIVAISMHPPAGGWRAVPAPFLLGILLAATGGCLVTLYKPPPAKAGLPPVQQAAVAPAAQEAP